MAVKFTGGGMGDSKRKKMLGASVVRRNELSRRFEQLGIDISTPGFYDDAGFLTEERRDRRFLEAYAEWVIHRERLPEYDAHVRDVLGKLVPIISARMDRHQWFGSCIAVTGMLTRMLDRLGVWNTVMRGSVAIKTVDGASRHFAIVDEDEGRGFETGHYWLIAPPFDIVDLTLYHQRWRAGDEAFQALAPKVVLAEQTEVVKARADDVIAPALLRSGTDAEMHRALSDQKRFGAVFPARKVRLDRLELRYVASGSTAPDVPLERVNLEARAGVPAIQIWTEDVAPAFGIR